MEIRMNTAVGVLIFAEIFLVNSAFASPLGDACRTAINAPDPERASQIAQMLLNFQGGIPKGDFEDYQSCIQDALGIQTIYDQESRRILTLEQQREEESLAEESAAERAHNQEMMDRIRANRIERRTEADIAIREACTTLYLSDSLTALTNVVCAEIFREFGLPED